MDKFYTKTRIAETCMRHVKTYITIEENDLVIEPRAGDGAFMEYMKPYHHKFYDIQPDHPDCTQQDYLTLDTTDLTQAHRKIHVIGNPPFGRQSSMAIKFIKKSCSFCNDFSFILPKSFKKNSMKKHIDLYFHLVFEIDLPDDSFVFQGKSYDVPCVFQIWEKRNVQRDIVEILEPLNFSFVKIDNTPDISIRRVGVNAGTIRTHDIDKKRVQSHYFIKFNNAQSLNKILSADIKYEHNNTVGPKSISKQEIIEKFNSIFLR
jgi:hypothetical protein